MTDLLFADDDDGSPENSSYMNDAAYQTGPTYIPRLAEMPELSRRLDDITWATSAALLSRKPENRYPAIRALIQLVGGSLRGGFIGDQQMFLLLKDQSGSARPFYVCDTPEGYAPFANQSGRNKFFVNPKE